MARFGAPFALLHGRRPDSRHRRANWHPFAGLSDDGGADRLAPSQKPHRLALLRRGLTLRDQTLHLGVRRVHPVRKHRFSPGGLRGLARFVTGGYVAGPRGSVPDAAVPRWPIAVSPMANRGRDGGLRSRVERALRRVRTVLRESV